MMAVMVEECEHGTLVRRHADYAGPEHARKLVDCPPTCKYNISQELPLTLVVTIVPKPGNELYLTKSGERWVRGTDRTTEGWNAESAHPFDLMDVLRDVLASQDSREPSASRIEDSLWTVKTVKLANRQEHNSPPF